MPRSKFVNAIAAEPVGAISEQSAKPSLLKAESITDRVSRAKARWLKRAMYESCATPTQKCFAYAISDHLNCVTLDAWPAQETLAQRLGHKSTKTILRATRALESLGLITVTRMTSGKSRCRYAPVFRVEDMDTPVPSSGQGGPRPMDGNVRESFLPIHTESSSTQGAAKGSNSAGRPEPSFNSRKRGAIEIKLSVMLGINGWDILARLSAIDDAIVERLCRACAEGFLSERDLAAARLAAEQA